MQRRTYEYPDLTPEEALHQLVRALLSKTYARRSGLLGLLRVLGPLRETLTDIEARLVDEARTAGHSWREVADALAISPATARRRHAHVGA